MQWRRRSVVQTPVFTQITTMMKLCTKFLIECHIIPFGHFGWIWWQIGLFGLHWGTIRNVTNDRLILYIYIYKVYIITYKKYIYIVTKGNILYMSPPIKVCGH